MPEIPEVMRHPAFRANPIPYKVLVPLYKRIVDKREYEREIRIKKNAELSLSLAKLPPRMQDYEDKRKLVSSDGPTKRSFSAEAYCTFQPPRAKPVPDFKRLQRQFQQSLDLKRRSQALTQPAPFVFHQPKSTAGMRQYLDLENQKINPTMRRPRSAAQAAERPGDETKNPATTAKFEAYKDHRRREMEDKKQGEEAKFQEEVQRFVRQNRMAQRVQCSPAIANTTAELQRRKAESIRRARQGMKRLEQAWEQQKALIEFNVANKPLLVEQVSKAFIRHLQQIRELQRYVNILREANLNPDEHLTDEQKELLLTAEYYDQLNQATAYFPSQQPLVQPQLQVVEDEGEGEEEEEAQEEQPVGSEPIEEQHEEDEEDEDEQ